MHGRLGRKLHTFGKDADDEPQSGHAYVASVDVRLSRAGSGESDAEPMQPLDPWGWESSSRGGTGDVQRGWEPDAKASRRRSAREEYRRPPVFGPERPVLDPHIRAVHKAVMRDMLMAGFVCTVVRAFLVFLSRSVIVDVSCWCRYSLLLYSRYRASSALDSAGCIQWRAVARLQV